MLKRLKWTLFDLQSVIQMVKALTLILQVYLHLVLRLAMFPGHLHRLTNLSILQWFRRMNCKMLKHWKRTLFDLQSSPNPSSSLILQVHLHLVLCLVDNTSRHFTIATQFVFPRCTEQKTEVQGLLS